MSRVKMAAIAASFVFLAVSGCGYRPPSPHAVLACQDIVGEDGGGAAYLDCLHGGTIHTARGVMAQ